MGVMRVRTRRMPQNEQFRISLDSNNVPGFRVTSWRAVNAPLPTPIVTTTMPRRRVRFELPQRGWQEHGWRLEGDRYVGHYRVGRRTWDGRAHFPPTHNRGGEFDFYVHHPPVGVKNHPCWHHAGQGWYWVNYHTPPPDLLSGIKHIEDFLAQVT